MIRRLFALVVAAFLGAFLMSGCATEQLASTTLNVSASATDVYYQMVLQNLARAYAEPEGLPWAMKLTSGGVVVNDTDTVAAGYSEKAQVITPTAALTGNRTWQRTWTTAPVTHIQTLQKLERYYRDVVISSRNGKTTVDDRDRNFAKALQGICAKDFHFCSGAAPSDTVSGRYGTWSAYVEPSDLSSLTDLTLAVINAMTTAPTTQGGASPYSQPAPPLNIQTIPLLGR